MGKISNKVSKGLSYAIQEAQAKINGGIVANINDSDNTENVSIDEVETLLNSGVEAQKKRKRRSKAEIEAAKQAEANELDISEEEDNRPEWEKRSAKNLEEFCEWELEKAKLKGLPEPEFDFRDYYEKGQIVFFVRVVEELGEKEIKKLCLRTIYPRMVVGSEEKAACFCIGYNDRDRIFLTPRDADVYSESIQLTPKYTSEEPKSVCKKLKDEDANEEDAGSEEVEENG